MVLLLAQENEWLTHDDAKGGRVFDLEEWVVHLEWTFRLRRWSQHGKSIGTVSLQNRGMNSFCLLTIRV